MLQTIHSPSTQRAYQIQDIISCGRFGTVYRAIEQNTKKRYAIKTLVHERHDVSRYMNDRMIKNEMANWKKVNGARGILHLEEIIDDDRTSLHQTCFVSEMCTGGTLKSFASSKSKTWMRIMKETLNALHSCHNSDIIHADVKPENILMTNDVCIRLADFGSSVDCMGNAKIPRTLFLHSTPAYAAPEISESWSSELCFKVDMWSFGILMRDMLFPSLIENTMQTHVMDLIDKCLQPNPSLRISSKDALKHIVWFN